jgi:hypothetical protein
MEIGVATVSFGEDGATARYQLTNGWFIAAQRVAEGPPVVACYAVWAPGAAAEVRGAAFIGARWDLAAAVTLANEQAASATQADEAVP